MIQSITSGRSAILPNLLRVQHNKGKMAIPVRPQIHRYVRFKHIIGIPDSQGGSSVPISKLRALDNLIEKLIGKEGQGESYLKITGKKADNLIAKLKSEFRLKQMSQSAKKFASRPEAGIMLNILV